MTGAPTVPSTNPNRVMTVLGVVILVGAGLYFLFTAVNGVGLPELQATARVVGKEYRSAGVTYAPQVIGGRTHALPQATPEAYVLKLEIGGEGTECAVPKELYEASSVDDKVQVVYQQKRLTGALHVMDVKR
jgi:hypothetical protein